MISFFKQFPEITAALSEKKDGSMKVFSEQSDEQKINNANREKLFREQGIAPDRVAVADLVHGTAVAVLSGENAGGGVVPATDALVTAEKNLFLSVTVADCLPVFFYDPVAEAIGIAHAGWRGIVSGVLRQTVASLRDCGAHTENISVAIGPGIQKCHFEIGTDIFPQFASFEKYITRKNGKIFVDLQGIAREQLENLGISAERIEASPLCTFCEPDRFFSYRRDKPEAIKVMVAVIGHRA